MPQRIELLVNPANESLALVILTDGGAVVDVPLSTTEAIELICKLERGLERLSD